LQGKKINASQVQICCVGDGDGEVRTMSKRTAVSDRWEIN